MTSGEHIEIHDKDGMDWLDAPLPRRLHRCKRQTWGWIGLSYTERCACGAIRFSNRGPWVSKNERRAR